MRAIQNAGYTEVEKRAGHVDRKVIWQIAARRGCYKRHRENSLFYQTLRQIERAKARIHAKVGHPFRVIKRQFGYSKVRFRGLAKNTA